MPSRFGTTVPLFVVEPKALDQRRCAELPSDAEALREPWMVLTDPRDTELTPGTPILVYLAGCNITYTATIGPLYYTDRYGDYLRLLTSHSFLPPAILIPHRVDVPDNNNPILYSSWTWWSSEVLWKMEGGKIFIGRALGGCEEAARREGWTSTAL
jgi:hypothetical protein